LDVKGGRENKILPGSICLCMKRGQKSRKNTVLSLNKKKLIGRGIRGEGYNRTVEKS